MEHKKVEWIQALRGVAALLVVIFHIDVNARVLHPDWDFTGFFFYFGYGGVNLFFVISGFVMVYISQEFWGKPRRWGGFIARRIIRVFPTYWVIYLGTFLAFYGYLHKAICFNGDMHRVIGSFILIRDPQDMCYIPQAWTLHWEIWFYAAFSVVFFLSRRSVIVLGAAWAAASAGIILFGRGHVSGWVFIWCVFNLHFLAGSAICLLYPRFKDRWAITAVVLGVAWFLGSGYVNYLGLMDTENVVHRLVQYVPASALILYGALGLEMRSIQPPQWLLLIGNASYSIYLSHLTVFLLYRRATAHMSHGLFMHTVWVFTMLAAALGAGIAFYWYVETPLLAWCKSTFLRRRRTAAVPSE